MITLIYGENAYERDQQVRQLTQAAPSVERYEGADVGLNDLPQLLQGVSLFSSQHIPIISDLSENKPVWVKIGEYLEGMGTEGVSLILVEEKPDKRTKTFKLLQKKAQVIECRPFSDKDTHKAAEWLGQYAKQQLIALDSSAAKELVRRVGVDQYRLLHELHRLAVMGDVTLDVVQAYTKDTDHDTAFDLLQTALRGDAAGVQRKIALLRSIEDPYKTLGLLISQAYGLAGLLYGGQDMNASDLGVHPFMVSRLRSVAKDMNEVQLRRLVDELAGADMQLKTTSIEPWLTLEVALTNIAQ